MTYTFKALRANGKPVEVTRKDGTKVGTLFRVLASGAVQWRGVDINGAHYPGPYRSRQLAAEAMDPEAML